MASLELNFIELSFPQRSYCLIHSLNLIYRNRMTVTIKLQRFTLIHMG